MSSYRALDDIIISLNEIDSTQDISKESMNEIMYISKNILQMHKKNDSLEQQLITSFSKLKKLQTETLQMQFAPHFLFNTLNTLNMFVMSLNGIKNPASKVIVLISDLLTISLNTSKYIVSIRQEIEYCKKYIEIEKIMNENSFDVVWNIDESIMSYKTVKLTLQPIIENAFKHGIKYLRNESRGYLEISAYEEPEQIVFEISSNGPVIEPSVIEQLHKSLDTGIMPENKHIGLRNVNKRIKLIFGNSYGCCISSTNYLTIVKVNIPKLTEFNPT
jgi:two-component system sensor histidine kinase YesM